MRDKEEIIEVAERGKRKRKSRSLKLGKNVKFSTEALETFAFKNWEPVIYDAMVVAASVECADKIFKRPADWTRRLYLQVPVNDVDLWMSPQVRETLRDAIEFLTGDHWEIGFRKLEKIEEPQSQSFLQLKNPTDSVVPFSDGMDSHAVAGIMCREGKKPVRVRMKPKSNNRPKKQTFVTVPYSVRTGNSLETSARSRGFKFAMMSAVAAYLTDVEKVIVPESGQEAIGSALLTVGQRYPDYRSSPLFTKRMEFFLRALFGRTFTFEFPRIWNTKSETLREFAALTKATSWKRTRSCWRDSRWVSVGGKQRQCGVCAACMLRRVSVHAAGLSEDPDAYVCTDMEAPTLEQAVALGFSKSEGAFREYAIAGVLHMDHLSGLAGERLSRLVRRHAVFLEKALEDSEAERKLGRLLSRHADEWKEYKKSLGTSSFVRKWRGMER